MTLSKQAGLTRSSSLLLLVTVLALLFSACAPMAAPTAGDDSGAAAPAEDATVVVLQGVDMTTLDPHYVNSLPEVNVNLHIFQTLMRFNDELELVPELAESYTSIDELTWEFKVKEGYTFHNGEPVNAEAFAFAINRGQTFFVNNEAVVAYQYDLLNLDRVEVVDDYTLRIITKEPNPILPSHMAHNQTAAMPPVYYTETDPDELQRHPIGSGPYKFVEWIPEERVVIEAWDEFKDGAPAIKRIIWRPVPEAATRIAELQAGNADIIVNVPPDLAESVEAADGVHLDAVPGMRRIFIGIKQERHPALADKRVRQALNYAFNCEGMMENLLAGRGECSAHIANAPDQSPNVDAYPYDPEKALALLAEAGYTDSDGDGILDKEGEKLALVFDTPNGRYIKDRDIAQVIASDLQKIGIEVELKVFDWSIYTEMTGQGGAGLDDLYLLGSGPGFNCRSDLALVQATSGSNRTGWSSEAFEAVWAELGPEFDPARRVELCNQLEEIAYEEAPLIFIWLQTDFYAASDRLNWRARPDERILLLDATIGE